MRAGICSIHLQALTSESATLVRQAVNLATRRGHAQVTPLHVAIAMLATSTSLLRKACLQCHSHPLHYKALELCFNVSLNRLPASTPNPLLTPPPQHSTTTTPSLSNALVAAFKRAQAHQRRGSIENQQQQQQPILALKIEVEQLIISILDDPSISRVMREAGFSSTLVKSRVEQAISAEVCSQQQTSKEITTANSSGNIVCLSSRSFDPFGPSFNNKKYYLGHVNDDYVDDVTSVLSELVSKRRNIVVVGESVTNAEGVVRGLMERLERGSSCVQGEMTYVQFVSLPLVSFRNISKEEVERKVLELRGLVKGYVGRGFILYLGDLKWLFEFWSNHCEQKTKCYCSVEHMVMELKKLVSGNGENGRLWLMGISTFRSYMKCKMCHPSLETILELHPFTVPVGSLSLGLNFDHSELHQERSKVIFKEESFEGRGKVHKHLTCCRDCSLNFEKEAKSITNSFIISKKDCTTSLPIWLKNCKEESQHQENANLWNICKKWNSFCSSVHGYSSNHHEKQFWLVSSSPSSPNSVSSHERKPSLHLNHLNWPAITEASKEVHKECELHTETSIVGDDCYEGNLIMFMPEINVPKPDLLSNPNSSPNSASSSEALEGLDSTEMFKEHNADNMKIICDALEKRVPQQKEMVKEIASTVLLCRSGMRRGKNHSVRRDEKQETWMLFLGVDSQAKEMVSKELAKVVFGPYSNFVSIGVSSFSSSSPRGDDSTHEESNKKRPRDEFGSSYVQRLGEAVNENPHRVFFMEDLEQVDHFSQKGIKQAIESGSITLNGAESVPLMDAIFIFSGESFGSVTRACSTPRTSPPSDENIEKEKNDESDEKTPSLSLDLNIGIEVDAQNNVHLDGNIGILELVDKIINFRKQEL
ncbi:hypothetical protein RJT34_24143 [Clitoria ternatea]|uniref:Clp R domain-containing protein n=1 Tax=Clitoria ternatea TaxID=43366 RepID=A0AAN9IHS4_CLITE